MKLAGRKALLSGAARSGIASARFLAQRGAIVALNDRKPMTEWSPSALALKTEGVGQFAGDPPALLLDQIDLVVVSPGVPTKAIPIRYADRRGAEVIGEVELASRFLRGGILAITGTNGKTTTTTLIGAMLNADDEIVSSWASGLRAKVVQFSVRRELKPGLFLRGKELVSRTKEGERVLATRDEMRLRGTHNVENVLAAMAACQAFGLPSES